MMTKTARVSRVKHIFSIHTWNAKAVWRMMFVTWALFTLFYAFVDVTISFLDEMQDVALNAPLIAGIGAIIMGIACILTSIMAHRWFKYNHGVKGYKATKFIMWIVIGFSVFMIAGGYVINSL